MGWSQSPRFGNGAAVLNQLSSVLRLWINWHILVYALTEIWNLQNDNHAWNISLWVWAFARTSPVWKALIQLWCLSSALRAYHSLGWFWTIKMTISLSVRVIVMGWDFLHMGSWGLQDLTWGLPFRTISRFSRIARRPIGTNLFPGVRIIFQLSYVAFLTMMRWRKDKLGFIIRELHISWLGWGSISHAAFFC
jgi:hypothetical protein